MRTVEVVDLFSGVVDKLALDTPTLDVPRDLDTDQGGVSVDGDGHAHYVGSDGDKHDYPAVIARLSTRVPGELYLVEAGGKGAQGRQFRLAMLDPR